MKIAIVGNGASLLQHNMGKSIDEFDEVVRFNDFRIKGYEKHVGTKATIWSINTAACTHQLERDYAFKYVLVQHTRFHNQHYDPSVVKRPNHIEINSKFHDDICEYSGVYDLNTSTGTQTIAHFAHGNDEVSIFGFDSFNPPRKYFDAQNDLYMPHSTNESRYINHLVYRGLIKTQNVKMI